MKLPHLSRNRLAYLSSLLTLSACMISCGGLFHLFDWAPPAWLQDLQPNPWLLLLLPFFLIFLCLQPVVWLVGDVDEACDAIADVVLLAPLAAVLTDTANISMQHPARTLFMALLNYNLIALAICAIPTVLAMGLCMLRSRWHQHRSPATTAVLPEGEISPAYSDAAAR
ncbi:hypothetical protein [Leeia aquatica]|uniref:Uncharacterized protein n=1 Tax=Leeia aquatica TaxID=2725557 RepID=A0A847RWI4_9NEIS|nr:hypothetical protein [Leeia aquatica]NLR74161.1 hypothetical protein [Leeia aquatica]